MIIPVGRQRVKFPFFYCLLLWGRNRVVSCSASFVYHLLSYWWERGWWKHSPLSQLLLQALEMSLLVGLCLPAINYSSRLDCLKYWRGLCSNTSQMESVPSLVLTRGLVIGFHLFNKYTGGTQYQQQWGAGRPGDERQTSSHFSSLRSTMPSEPPFSDSCPGGLLSVYSVFNHQQCQNWHPNHPAYSFHLCGGRKGNKHKTNRFRIICCSRNYSVLYILMLYSSVSISRMGKE